MSMTTINAICNILQLSYLCEHGRTIANAENDGLRHLALKLHQLTDSANQTIYALIVSAGVLENTPKSTLPLDIA